MSSPTEPLTRTSPALEAARAVLTPVAVLAAGVIATLVQPNFLALLRDPAVQVVGGGHPAAVVFGLSLLSPVMAAAVTLTARLGGHAVALMVAPVLALLAVPLARDVRTAGQLGAVTALSAVAAGALIGAGLVVAAQHSGRTQAFALLGWLLPLVVVPALVGWQQWAAAPGEGVVAVMAEPPVALLSAAVGVTTCFGLLAFGTLGHARSALPTPGATAAAGWLVAALAVLTIIGVLTSWHLDTVSVPWLRTLTIASTVIVTALLAMAAWPLRGHPVASAYPVVLVVGVIVLPLLGLGVARVAVGTGPSPPMPFAVGALLSAAVVGGGIGCIFSSRAVVVLGLLLSTVAAAATVVPAEQWWWPLPAVATLVAAAGAALAARVRRTLQVHSESAVTFLAVGLTTAIVLGRVVEHVVVGWALGGGLPRTADDVVTAGRIAAGLGVTALVLATTAVAVWSRGEDRRVTAGTDVTIA